MFNNLNAELTRIGMKTETYAKYLGVSKKTVNNKLSGRTEFTLVEIEKTAALFPNMSVDYLFNRNKATA